MNNNIEQSIKIEELINALNANSLNNNIILKYNSVDEKYIINYIISNLFNITPSKNQKAFVYYVDIVTGVVENPCNDITINMLEKSSIDLIVKNILKYLYYFIEDSVKVINKYSYDNKTLELSKKLNEIKNTLNEDSIFICYKNIEQVFGEYHKSFSNLNKFSNAIVDRMYNAFLNRSQCIKYSKNYNK